MDFKHLLHQRAVAVIRAQLGLQTVTGSHGISIHYIKGTLSNGYLESHDEDTECIQDSQAHFGGDVSLQQRLVQHICI